MPKGRIHLFESFNHEGANTDVGYMTQKDNLLPWRTVRKNVLLALEFSKTVRNDLDPGRPARVRAVRAGRRGHQRDDLPQRGLGYMLTRASGQFDTSGVFAAIAVMMMLAIVVNGLVAAAER